MTRAKNKRSSSFSDILYEYGKSSSIHGLGYIFTNTGLVFDRILWLVIFLITGCVAVHLTMESFNHWQNNQVITTLKDMDRQVEGMDFPAVTVCGNGLQKDLMEMLLKNNYLKWVESRKKMDDVSTERYMLDTFQIKNNSINIVDIIDTMISPSEESTEANFVRQNQLACKNSKEKTRIKRDTGGKFSS